MEALSLKRDYVHRDSLVIFLVALLLFTLGLSPEFVGFQARFARFAQEMLQHGPTWFPTIYGRPYPDYPGTSTFLIYMLSLLFGKVTPMAAVFPTAVVSGLILVVTYRIGALHSRRLGLMAVLFALMTVDFLSYSRNIALDQYTSLAATVSFYLVYSATCRKSYGRLGWLPVVWILGFAFRGPIGLVVPVAVACSYSLWNVRLKQLFCTALGGGMTLGCCMLGFWLVARTQGGVSLVEKVMGAQISGRMGGRGQGVAYYWLNSLVSLAPTYPLALLVLGTCFKDMLRRRERADRFMGSLMCWILVVLVGLSIPSVKKSRYILPIVPALSLVAAHVLLHGTDKKTLARVRRLFLDLCYGIVPLVTIAIPVLFLVSIVFFPSWHAHYLTTFLILLLANLLLKTIRQRLSGQPNHDMILLAVLAVVCVAMRIGIADPIYYHQEKTRPFVQKVETLQEIHPGDLVFYRIGPDREDMKFMANLSKPQQPQFISSLGTLGESAERHYIIAREDVFSSMPAQQRNRLDVLTNGRIGHRDVVLFTERSSTPRKPFTPIEKTTKRNL